MSRLVRSRSLVFRLAILGFIVGVGPGLRAEEKAPLDPLDWPMWRGPEMNGISREKNLVSSWSPEGENLLWRKEDYATRSTPIVLRGKLYIVCRSHPETTQEGEKVVCINAATGELIWETAYNVFLSDAPAERVGWSSPVGDPATGHIHVLSVGCLFQCLHGETGKVLWSHSMSEEYGMLSTYGGRTNFPVVFEDVVIISGVMTGWGEYAVPAQRFVAFDKKTGQAVWILSTRLRPEDTTYSTPVFGVFRGQQAMVFAAGDGSVYAVQPRTGAVIWRYDASTRGINNTPVIDGDVVYCGHGEQNFDDQSILGAFFAIDATGTGDVTKTHRRWSVPGRAVNRSSALLLNDRLYCVEDSAAMFVLNAKTGEEVGKQKLGTIMFGSSVYGDGKLYVGEATGRCYILEPSAKGVKIAHKLRLEGEEILGSPIISHGRIYLPSTSALYCIGDAKQTPAADPLPTPRREAPISEDTQPAHVQVSPVELILKPGAKQALTTKIFNSKGQSLPSEKVQWTVEGPGQIDDAGTYTAPASGPQAAAIITAAAGNLKGSARVRVIPPLPWSFDFADGKVPVTWIGATYRYQAREIDGKPTLVKVTTIPKGTRSQSWMGPPDLHDYTITATVKGGVKDGKQPDMGVINQRYTLDLMGKQQLQIRSWTPRLELRFAKTIPFEWKPNVWYVLKFQSENKAGAVTLRGKVWPKEEREPAGWTIEGTDETPNVTGSPGLFGNSSDAEIHISQVQVVPNGGPSSPPPAPASTPAKKQAAQSPGGKAAAPSSVPTAAPQPPGPRGSAPAP